MNDRGLGFFLSKLVWVNKEKLSSEIYLFKYI